MPFFRKMETRRMYCCDMKQLVLILRGIPTPGDERMEAKYRRYTKDDIQMLPRRLKHSYVSFNPEKLCSIHKVLDVNLINDLWAWMRHELQGAIGKFLYPLVISGRLTAEQELKLRQLEPVLQMWKKDFSVESSAPPFHEPIQAGSRWHYQEDQCPACMMARIGSDEKVLFALFAGMVGRFHTKSPVTIETQVASWEKSKSKRLRFVRYWLKATRDGEKSVFEAGQLGVEMKKKRFEWKAEQRNLEHFRLADSARPSLDNTTAPNTPKTRMFRPSCETERSRRSVDAGNQERRSRPADIDTAPLSLRETVMLNAHDAKIGPEPRSSDVRHLSPADKLGFDVEGMRERLSPGRYNPGAHGFPPVQPSARDPAPDLKSTPRRAIPLLHHSLPARKAVPVRKVSNESLNTVTPDDSISMIGWRPAPLRVRRRAPYSPPLSPTAQRVQLKERNTDSNTNKRADSVHGSLLNKPSMYDPSFADTQTILSYTGPSSRSDHTHVNPFENPAYDRIETNAEREARYRKMLAGKDPCEDEEDDVSVLPAPSRSSIYEAFANIRFDLGMFDLVDEEVPIGEWGERVDMGRDGGDDEHDADEDEDGQKTPRQEDWRRSDGSIAWEDLY